MKAASIMEIYKFMEQGVEELEKEKNRLCEEYHALRDGKSAWDEPTEEKKAAREAYEDARKMLKSLNETFQDFRNHDWR